MNASIRHCLAAHPFTQSSTNQNTSQRVCCQPHVILFSSLRHHSDLQRASLQLAQLLLIQLHQRMSVDESCSPQFPCFLSRSVFLDEVFDWQSARTLLHHDMHTAPSVGVQALCRPLFVLHALVLSPSIDPHWTLSCLHCLEHSSDVAQSPCSFRVFVCFSTKKRK